MSKSRIAIAMTVLALSLAIASVAQARYVGSYNMIVPKLGGTVYSGSLTKVNTSRAVDNNTSNGGGYTMYTAIYRPAGTRVSAQYYLSSGARVLLAYNSGQAIPTSGYRLGHTNKLTTIVDVQTSGSWSPDEY